MSEKVSVTLKVDAAVRAGLMVLAKLDRRTMSSYVESWVDREVKEKKIDAKELEAVSSRKPKIVKQEESVGDLRLPEGVSLDVWLDFVSMRETSQKAKMTPLTLRAATFILKQLERAMENGWDADELLEEATAREWMMPVYEKHLENKPAASAVRNDYDDAMEQVRKTQQRLGMKV